MLKYKYLLWDIDGTVLNFLAAEREAMKKVFRNLGLGECTEEMIRRYSVINRKYWQAMENGEIPKNHVLIGRFTEFLRGEGIATEIADEFNREYQIALGDTIVFCEDSYQILKKLKGKYILAAITNGTKTAQSKKLLRSGLIHLFDYIFISEDIGIEKPNKGFFDFVFEKMNIQDNSQVLVIGDSLTSDIRGGNNANVDTCWYNPDGCDRNVNVSVTYEIKSFRELDGILGISWNSEESFSINQH